MIKTNPLSCKDLKGYAVKLREHYNIPLDKAFPILDVIEDLENKSYFNLVVVENDEVLETESVVACYKNSDNTIYIKEMVYDITDYRSNFTLAHELFHYFQVKQLNFSFEETDECPAYLDAEWQANEFAAQLLIPEEYILENIDYLMKNFKVSEECATYRKVKVKQRKEKKEKQNITTE